jgi:hypothetical protein
MITDGDLGVDRATARDAPATKVAVERGFDSRRPLDRLEIFVQLGRLGLGLEIVIEARPTELGRGDS